MKHIFVLLVKVWYEVLQVEAMSNDENVTFIFAGYENDMKRLFQAINYLGVLIHI